MDQNLISIIIATKNGGRFLSRSLASIEKQTDKNLEVIIVSDGSTDNTVEIAQKMAETRPFIKVLALNQNIGPGLARNIGIKEARGKYIALLDDDDEWLDENKLNNQRKFLDQNPQYVLIGSNETEFVNEDLKRLFVFKPETDDRTIRSKLLLANQFVTSSVMFRKGAFEKAGGFAAMFLAEDYDQWLRLAQQGKVANLQNCLTRYYKRSNSAQSANQQQMNRIVLELIKKYQKNFPNSGLAKLKAYIRIFLKTSSGTSLVFLFGTLF